MRKGRHKAQYQEEKDGETQKLKNTIRRLQSDIKKLKSEIKTYEQAFQKNITFLKGKTKDLTLQELLDGAKKEQSLVKIEAVKEETYQEHKAKWKCFQCNEGVMKLIIVPRQDGKYYMRCCSNTGQCKHRTELKPLTEDVELS